MKPLLRFLLCGALLLGNTIASAESSSVVVRMEPFRVTAGYFSVDATFTDAGKTIRQVRVTWISPDINKLKIGLRVGDSLVSVNQQPVVGMKSATLGDLFEIVLKAGEKRTFLFRGKRGLFGKDWFSTIIITRPDAEMPNHPTSPTTAQPPIQP